MGYDYVRLRLNDKPGTTMRIALPVFFFVLLLVPLSLSGSASAAECADRPVLSGSEVDGTELGIYVPQERLPDSLHWAPGRGDPPLKPSQAARAAKAWAERTYPGTARIRGIWLHKHPCASDGDRWFYMVDFTLAVDGKRVPPLFNSAVVNSAVVLMNGSTIGPEKLRTPKRDAK